MKSTMIHLEIHHRLKRLDGERKRIRGKLSVIPPRIAPKEEIGRVNKLLQNAVEGLEHIRELLTIEHTKTPSGLRRKN